MTVGSAFNVVAEIRFMNDTDNAVDDSRTDVVTVQSYVQKNGAFELDNVLEGTTSVQAASGVATFSDLEIGEELTAVRVRVIAVEGVMAMESVTTGITVVS